MTQVNNSRRGGSQQAAALVRAAERVSGGNLLGVGKFAGWTRALGGLLVAAACSPALAGPEGAQVVRGNVDITRNGAETLIRAGNNSIINYSSFNIGANESVRFLQPSSTSRVLNRITSAAPTRIDGSITANGRVYIVNPAGVIFGNGARVDVNSLYAAGGNLSNTDFLAGRDNFTGLKGTVENRGTIEVSKFAGLVGQQVFNSGTINAPKGTVVMASGSDVMIGERTGNVYVKIKAPTGEVKAGEGTSNTGIVNASGGRVIMGAGDIYSIAVRAAGSVKADDIKVQASGGNVAVAGTLDASNANGEGGTIEVLGDRISLINAKLDASGKTGGGQVNVGGDFQGVGDRERASVVTVDAGSTIDVSATGKGHGGTAVVWSDHYTQFEGTGLARGGAQGGDGGLIETSSKDVVNLDPAKIDAGSVSGNGGTWLIDPRNVTISSGATTDMTPSGGSPNTFTPVTPVVTTSNVSVTDIQASLNGGTSVVITTAQAAENTDAGDITVLNSITKTAGGNATLTLRAQNDITINSGVTISATAGQLGVTLEANSSTGDTASGTGSVFLNGTINTNGGAFSSSGVGFTQSGTGVITAGGGVTITHTGTVSVAGTVTGGAVDIDSGAGGISLGGAIVTSGDTVRFRDAVTLTASSSIDTTGSASAGGANITFDSTVDGTTDGAEDLTLNGGTGGDITFTGNVGTTTRVGDLAITNSDDVGASGLRAATFTQTTGNGATVFGGTVDTTGLISVANDDITVAGDVTSAAGGITFAAANGLTVNNKVTATTGDISATATTGTLSVTSTGGETGELDAAAGDTTLVTNTLSLTGDGGEFQVTGGGDVAIRSADNRGIRIGGGGGGFMAIAAATLENRIATVASRVITLGNSSTAAIEIDADLTLANGLAVETAGNVTWVDGGPDAPTVQATSLSVRSGMDGTGNIVFEDDADVLTNSATFQAGSLNGTNSAATFTGLNFLALRSIGSTDAPASVTWGSDAAITATQLPVMTIPAGGITYSIRSFGGTLTIGTASRVNGADLTLQGAGAGVDVTTDINVRSLVVNSTGVFDAVTTTAAGITANGNATFSGAVSTAGAIDVTGSFDAVFSSTVTTTGGGIDVGDDVNFGGAVSITGGNFESGGDAAIGAGLTTTGSVTVGATTTLTGTIRTAGGMVDLNGSVNLSGAAAVDTTNSGGSAGADIIFGSTLNGANRDLTITAGTGSFTVTGATGGTGGTRLDDIVIESADTVTMGTVNTVTLTQNNATGTTTLGNITATGAVRLGTVGTPLMDLDLGSVSAASLQVIVGNLNTVTLDGPVTLSGSFVHSGGQLDLGGDISSTSGFIQSTNLRLTGGATTLTASNNATGIVITSADLNGNDLTLVGSRVHFNGGAASIGGAGVLTMRPVLNTDGITIGADLGTANILFVTGLTPLASTLTEVHFGNASGGTHTINVPASTFLSDVTFHGGVVNVNGDLSTAGKSITINADVSLASAVTIATDVGDAAGAAINITGDITRSNVLGGLTLSAGTDGDVDLDGDAGTSGAALANFTVTTADIVNANDVFAGTISQAAANNATYGTLNGGAGGITLVGTAISLSGGATTTGGGQMHVTNSGLFTVGDDIALDGALLQDGAGATSLTSAGAFTVSTTNDDITFTSGVGVTGTSVSFDAGSGAVAFSGTLTVGGGASITLSADEIDFNGGANSVSGTGRVVLQPGTDGVDVEVGSALDQAGRLDLTTADLAALDNTFTSGVGAANTAIIIGRATGTQHINVNAGAFSNDVFFRGSGTGTIALAGTLTGAGSIRADAGDISLGADITSNGTLALVGDVTLTADANLNTSNDQVVITGTVNATTAGVEGLDIDAGTADVLLNADVGGITRLGLFRVIDGHTKYNQSITVNSTGAAFGGQITATGTAGNRDLTIDAGTGNLSFFQAINAVDGAVDLSGAVVALNNNLTGGDVTIAGTTLNLSGDIIASGAVDLAGDTINQTGSVSSDSYVAQSQGAVVVSDDVTATGVDGIRILSGLSGSGDLTFGATGVTLTSNTIELAAGDGTGTATVNVRGNSPTFAGNSGSVTSFEVRQDGSMTGADFADLAQFTGGIDGMSYILNAVNGSLTIADSGAAANVAGSRLDLSALDNTVTGGIAISTDLNLEALQTRAVVTYSGATIAASDSIVHDQEVVIDGGVAFRAGELDFAGAVTGVGVGNILDIETFAAGRDIFLGGDGTELGTGSTQALHLTASEINLFADGLSGIRIGGATNSGLITVKTNVTFKDALTLRASAPGGGVSILQTLKNTTSDGSVTILGSGATTTISGSIVTSGQAITINDRVIVQGTALLDTTNAGASAAGANVKVGFDAGSGDAIADAINAHSSGGDLTIRGGTAGVITLASVGETQHLDTLTASGAAIELSSVATDGDQTYTGTVTLTDTLRSHSDGSITITGNLVVAGSATIRTSGDQATDDITITGTINADSAASNRDLTISAGAIDQSGAQGQIVIGGAIGGTQALNDMVISGDGTTMLGATTTGVQTYFGATRIGGNMSGSRLDFNDALTLNANVVMTASNTDSDAEQVEIESVNSFGSARTLTINALNTRINGSVGGTSKLASLTTDSSGRTRFMSTSVRTVGDQSYLDAVQLGDHLVISTESGNVRFASTVQSFGGNHDLTVNTAGSKATMFEGIVGGSSDAQKLRNLTTNADGTVEFSANVRTTGAQTYDDAATLNANVTFTGDSFEFATINSEAGAGRTLTLNGTGSIIVNGAIGQAGADTALGALTADGGNMSFVGVTVTNAVNLDSTGNIAHTGDVAAGSYTAEATTVSLRKLTTSGGQTIDGDVTLNDDLTVTGTGSINLDGAVTVAQDVTITTNNQSLSVSGAVNSGAGSNDLIVNVGTSTATFSADIGGTAALGSLDITASNATTRQVGTVGAQTYSGGLTTGFNHTATGAGDITITGVLTLTGDAVFTTANGSLFYNGGVSGGESLTTHAGGAGKFSRFTGANAFQKLITEGEARINTTAISASEEMDFKNGVLLETSTTLTAPKATFRSVIDGAGLNLAVNATGQTDFQGVIGGAGALGTLTTDAAGTTRIAGNATTTGGMTFNDAVTIGADIELRGGAGSLRFGKTIDSTANTPFALSLFSDASANGSLANTPFVFGGSIGNAGATTKLKTLTLSFQTDGNNVNRAIPQGATAFFATLNGDGTVAKGTDFRINTTQGFTMKPGQKLTSLGNLFINATNTGVVTLGDLTALGNINVTAGVVNIQLRGGSAVKNNPNDLGVDMVATGDISFGGVIPTLLNRSGVAEKERVSFANNSGVFNILTGAATDQFLFLKKANPVVENTFKDGGLFAPLDVTATGVSGVNAATIIAGAIPRDTETREVATPVTVSAALRKDLELMGMDIKDLEIGDLIEFLVGRAFYRDVPLTAAPQPKDYKVTVNRLSTPSVQEAVNAYRKLVFLPGDINRTEAIRDTIAMAWDAYTQQAQNPDGLGFREYLETKAASGGTGEAEALQFLNDTRMVFERLDELGLSPAESNIPKTKLLGDIRPPAMDESQISTAVLGMQVSSR